MGPRWPYLLRQGISNLHRPRNQTLLFLLSLGLGTFLMVTILLAGNLLNQRLSITQASNSPNLYLIDVQPDQLDGVKGVMGKLNLPVLESAPMVTMRIETVRGVPVREVKGVPRWVARREFRSTYRDAMNETETLIAGEWYKTAVDPNGPVPLSLEEGIAKELERRRWRRADAGRAGRVGQSTGNEPAEGRLEQVQPQLLHGLPPGALRARRDSTW